MISIFRLIRLPNLLIIALTLYFTKYFLIRPMIEISGAEVLFSKLDFFLFNLSIIFIAAAGYIINDYFDTKIDFINKPEKIIIDKKINRKHAIVWHVILSTLGILLGIYSAIRVGFPKLCLIHILSVGLLWFYSTDFKRMFLIGNIVVAFLSGLIPIMAALFEPNKIFISFKYIAGYAIFAFITSLIREIIKDMEDVKGDAALNCKTLPVVLGIKTTKTIIVTIVLATMLLMGYIQSMQFRAHDLISFWYFTITIQLPFAILIYLTLKAENQQHFHRASTITKIIMFTGVLSMFIFYYSLLA